MCIWDVLCATPPYETQNRNNKNIPNTLYYRDPYQVRRGWGWLSPLFGLKRGALFVFWYIQLVQTRKIKTERQIITSPTSRTKTDRGKIIVFRTNSRNKWTRRKSDSSIVSTLGRWLNLRWKHVLDVELLRTVTYLRSVKFVTFVSFYARVFVRTIQGQDRDRQNRIASNKNTLLRGFGQCADLILARDPVPSSDDNQQNLNIWTVFFF